MGDLDGCEQASRGAGPRFRGRPQDGSRTSRASITRRPSRWGEDSVLPSTAARGYIVFVQTASWMARHSADLGAVPGVPARHNRSRARSIRTLTRPYRLDEHVKRRPGRAAAGPPSRRVGISAGANAAQTRSRVRGVPTRHGAVRRPRTFPGPPPSYSKGTVRLRRRRPHVVGRTRAGLLGAGMRELREQTISSRRRCPVDHHELLRTRPLCKDVMPLLADIRYPCW